MRSFAVLAAVMVVLVGCNRISTLLESGPEGALRSYLNASTQGDLKTAYGFVSASDRAARSVADYQSAEGNPFASAFAGMVTHKIVNVTEYGAAATAQVDVTAPDASQLMGDLIGPAFATAFGGGEVDSDKLAQDLANKYKNADLPKVTRRNEYQLVRDPDGWRVFMDWERADRVSDLVAEAKRLHEARDLTAAATTYEEVLELDSKLVAARNGLERVRKDIEKQEADAAILREKQDYMSNVRLKTFRVGDGQSWGQSVKGVFGTVVNEGNRTLDKVEVTVYFLDKEGNVVGEEDYHPVLVNSFSIGDNKPLKPNYVEDFGYSVKDTAPSTWDGRAQAKITDIAFAK